VVRSVIGIGGGVVGGVGGCGGRLFIG